MCSLKHTHINLLGRLFGPCGARRRAHPGVLHSFHTLGFLVLSGAFLHPKYVNVLGCSIWTYLSTKPSAGYNSPSHFNLQFVFHGIHLASSSAKAIS